MRQFWIACSVADYIRPYRIHQKTKAKRKALSFKIEKKGIQTALLNNFKP
jgi:hypothetical protein